VGAAGAHSTTRKLTPPLKGNNSSDSGGGPSDKSGGQSGGRLHSLAGVRWRVCPVRKVARNRRLVLLRGYARAHGRLQRVELRAMLDTGAQGEFISPSLASVWARPSSTGALVWRWRRSGARHR
jgi:hypothetical protein